MELETHTITIKREGRKYYAYCADFPGVYGLGGTTGEARASIVESIRLYVEECRAQAAREDL